MMWFRNSKVKSKLMMGFGAILAISTLIAYQATSKMAEMNAHMALTYDRGVMGLSEIKESAADQLKCARLMRNAVIATGDLEAVEKNNHKMEQEFAGAHAHLANAEPRFVTADDQAALATLKAKLAEYEAACHTIVGAARTGNFQNAKAELKKSSSLSDLMVVLYTAASKLKEKEAEEGKNQAADIYTSSRRLIMALSIAALAVGAFLAFLIGSMISNPVIKAATVMKAVADGNLTMSLEIDSKDELGMLAASINRAIKFMSQALQEVRRSAETLTATAEQLASGSNSLAAGTQESTASLEETSASLEQITATVRQNSDNARQASSLTGVARETAENGGKVVQMAVAAMVEINESSGKIAEIVTSMDEVAFQTNLLAVNAAVEAAHAGEQGRGFAVVAEEVRALAKRSAVAARQIRNLISDSVEKVAAGSEFVNRSGETLQEIIASVKRAAGIVEEISAACAEQSTGISQVNSAVNQMNSVAQQSGQKTDEVSSGAYKVSQQATELRELLGHFVLPESVDA